MRRVDCRFDPLGETLSARFAAFNAIHGSGGRSTLRSMGSLRAACNALSLEFDGYAHGDGMRVRAPSRAILGNLSRGWRNGRQVASLMMVQVVFCVGMLANLVRKENDPKS
jgi:hypothetical protein